MKKIIVLTCILLPLLVRANEIDKLQTNGDVVHFLVKHFGKSYQHLSLFYDPKTQNKSGFGRNKFYKTDLNKDGLTDMVVDGYLTFAVTAEENNSYELFRFGKTNLLGNGAYLISIDSTTRTPIIVIGFRKTLDAGTRKVIFGYDTIVYKCGGFVEWRKDTVKGFRFDKFDYETTVCLGNCPAFKMAIDSNGNVIYTGNENSDPEGQFTATIPKVEFDKLTALLAYIDPNSLDSSYSVHVTDHPTATTTIWFNGNNKKITDEGERGTYGLRTLYRLLFSWQKKLHWEKI